MLKQIHKDERKWTTGKNWDDSRTYNTNCYDQGSDSWARVEKVTIQYLNETPSWARWQVVGYEGQCGQFKEYTETMREGKRVASEKLHDYMWER